MPATIFNLVRHASTDALGTSLSGRTATRLNPDGQNQAARLARSFVGDQVTAILSSPQLRTIQTAAAIAGVVGLPVQPEPALDEVDFGPWTGQTFVELAGVRDWALWNSHRSLAPAPGSETMLDVQARAFALLPRLHAAEAGGIFILVSHADIVKAILALALAIPIDMMQRLEISPASRSRLVLHDGGLTVEFINLIL